VQEELKLSEEKYRLAFVTGLDAYMWTNVADGRIIEINQVFEDIFDFTREEAIGKTTLQLNLWDDPSDRTKILSDLKAKGFVKDVELKGRKKDGKIFIGSFSASKMLINNQLSILAVIRDITERKKAEEQLKQTLASFRKAFGATIQVMVSAVEMRDPYTAGHQLRVADLARSIAIEMGLSTDKIDGIQMAGSIHDIGKLSIPAEILSKPTKLTNNEFSIIKDHSRIGYEILKNVESSWPLAEIVHQHHERINGSGYPRNLKGEEILMEARIMAVADVVEAMASDRPYRPGLGIDAALAEIEKNKGIFYDNTVADACLRLFREKGYQLK
jgi:PAS domain S-box-containing protein